jgi:hypothetical protein
MVSKAATPSAARNFLNTVRALMKFTIETGIRPDNPTIGIKRVKIKTTGYATWTEDDIASFETKHPIGTRARTIDAVARPARRSFRYPPRQAHAHRAAGHAVPQRSSIPRIELQLDGTILLLESCAGGVDGLDFPSHETLAFAHPGPGGICFCKQIGLTKMVIGHDAAQDQARIDDGGGGCTILAHTVFTHTPKMWGASRHLNKALHRSVR